MLKDFENRYNVKLPKDIYDLFTALDDNFCEGKEYWVFNSSDDTLFIIINDNLTFEYIRLNIPEYEEFETILNVINNKISNSTILKKNQAFFPFAITADLRACCGCLFMDNQYKGVFEIYLNEARINKISENITPDLFEINGFELNFKNYRVISEALQAKGEFKYPKNYTLLFNTVNKIKVDHYNDILSEEQYFVTDSECLEDFFSYKHIFDELNKLFKNEIIIKIDDSGLINRITVNDNKEILISKENFNNEVNVISSDYFDSGILRVINKVITDYKLSSKKLVQFWDFDFGQEIGIAYVDSLDYDKLRNTKTLKIWDFEKNMYN